MYEMELLMRRLSSVKTLKKSIPADYATLRKSDQEH